jgi:hypothetical protein
MTTPADLLAMAGDLGHDRTQVGPTGTGRFYCRCSCGWGQPDRTSPHPVSRASEPEAAQAVIQHLTTALQRYLSDCLRDGVEPVKIKHRPTVT